VTSQVAVCGRCGASNPQDGEFCQSCGAFMAAYQAPAGAKGEGEVLTRPVETTPHSEMIYIPPAAPTPEPRTLEIEPELVAEVRAPDSIQLNQPIASEIVASKALPTVQTQESALAASTANPTHYPVRPGKYSYTPPPVQPAPTTPEVLPPAPAIFQKVFGEYADDVYYPTKVPGARRSGTSPQSLILLGIAALLGVCIAAAVASSNGTILLLIGGPLACSLIAIGILMLVGRYPTGRP
jgi:hypothetical protein